MKLYLVKAIFCMIIDEVHILIIDYRVDMGLPFRCRWEDVAIFAGDRDIADHKQTLHAIA